MSRFLVAVSSEHVRDVQVFDGVDWRDFFGELILGVYEGVDAWEAMRKASKYEGVSKDILVCYELADMTRK